MPLYFFDTRDDNRFIVDEEGVECRDVQHSKVVAAASLAELARDVICGSTKRELAVDVRDGVGPVLVAKLTFEAVILRPA